jgi:hypothetical protein
MGASLSEHSYDEKQYFYFFDAELEISLYSIENYEQITTNLI